ncbi:MAG: hypothetical protein PWQ20_1870 [Thermotogaceae bacterium]|nr:hypothetical protein [Thermotogaceae bacterium]
MTAPNALRYSNFIFAQKNIEVINSDHRYWFTPYTLSKIALMAGIKPIDIVLAETYPNNDVEYGNLIRKYPLFRDDIILIGEL